MAIPLFTRRRDVVARSRWIDLSPVQPTQLQLAETRREINVAIGTVVIEANDASYRHQCGTMVSPTFNGSGEPGTCPRCGESY